MIPKTNGRRPPWLLPLVALAAPVAVAGLMAVPMVVTFYLQPKPKLEPLPPARPDPVLPTPVPQPVAAPAPASTPVAGLSADDASSYESEIQSLGEMAKERQSAGQRMREIGALDDAISYLKQSSAYLKLSSCLYSQRKAAVPFYEAKARCKAAES
jgi:hypothetical protein